MSLHMPGLKDFNEAKILEYAVLTSGSTNPDEMRKALDESDGFEMITGPNKGYDPATQDVYKRQTFNSSPSKSNTL